MRLNLGCGSDRRPQPWLNVDLRDDVADVVCDVTQLDTVWDVGSIDELLALDVLEHFPKAERYGVLTHWHDMLVDDGMLTLRVPNLVKLSAQLCDAYERYASSSSAECPSMGHCADRAALKTCEHCSSFDQLQQTIENVYGGHRWGAHGALDAHHWGYTPLTLQLDLRHAGFDQLYNDSRHNMTAKFRKL